MLPIKVPQNLITWNLKLQVPYHFASIVPSLYILTKDSLNNKSTKYDCWRRCTKINIMYNFYYMHKKPCHGINTSAVVKKLRKWNKKEDKDKSMMHTMYS